MINTPNITTAFVDKDGKPTQLFFRVIEALVNQQILDGTGSPEGVLTAPFKARYWDNSAQKLYFKSTPREDAFGWVALN